MSANVIWLPIGNRLKRLGELEAARMELVIEGVAAIQAGSNPRIDRPEAALAAARRQQPTTPRRPEHGRRRARRHAVTRSEEEHENHERWLVTYADMVTLLMVLFIVMFAMSQVDEKKFNALKAGLAAGFGQTRRRCMTGSELDPRPAGRSHDRRRSTPTRRTASSTPGAAGRGQGRSPSATEPQQTQYAEAQAEVDRLEKIRRQSSRRRCAQHGLRDDVQRTIDERGPGGQPGLAARRLRADRGRPQPPAASGSSTPSRRCCATSPNRCASTATPTRCR